MNQLNQKIWQFVQCNTFILEEAFFYRSDKSDFKDFIWDKKTLKKMDSRKSDLYQQIDWLYHTNCSTSYSVIGVHQEYGKVYVISGQGDIFYVCRYFQLLPYYLIRETMNAEDIDDFYNYFKKPHRLNKEPALRKYEAWCQSEGIILDKYHFFINQDGTYNPEAFFSGSEGEYDYEGN
jgi:hypothetical protein